ncbi:MAG: ABC transporter permease subunit [Thermoleophilia bacterium]|nr:ABC transporter permease subunit [Thermoleophilia bacterium]
MSAGLLRNPIHRTRGLVPALPLVALVTLLVAIPVVLLVTYAFRESSFAGVGAGPTLEQFKEVFESKAAVRLIVRTVGMSVLVSTIACALAFVFSYGVTFRLKPRAAMILLAVVLSAGIASFLARIFAWGTILGTNGLINSALIYLNVIEKPLGFLFFGYFATTVTMVYLYLPVALLIVYGAMRNIDPRSIQASNDLGAGRWRTAFRVVAPQTRTGLVAAFVLLLLMTSADYITPRLVGGTSGQMIGVLVRDLALSSGNTPAAAALAISYLALLAVAVCCGFFLLKLVAKLAHGRTRIVDQLSAWFVLHGPSTFTSRSFSRPASFVVAIFLIVPTLCVVLFSLNDSNTLGLPIQGFTLEWYPDIVNKPGFTDALTNSVTIVLAAALLAPLIAIPYALVLQRAKGVGRYVLWSVAILPWLVPGVLLGLGLLIAASANNVQLGVNVTMFVHVLIVAPIMVMVVYVQLVSLDPRLSEAARDLGSSAFRAFRTVILPLIVPSILGAMLIGAAYSLDEILVTSFTIGNESTLPVWLLGQSRRGFNPGIDALAVMLTCGTISLFVAALLVQRTLSTRTMGGEVR